MGCYLVTGGAGFIGSHLCDRVLAEGHSVRVLDDLSTGRRLNLDQRVDVIVGDVANPESVAAACSGVTGVFHLAAIASVQRSIEAWPTTHRVNQSGTVNVLEAAREIGCPVVITSSAAVYGASRASPLMEVSPTRPVTLTGPRLVVRFGFAGKGLWHTLERLRAGPVQKGFVPVQLGLTARVKYFGRYKAGWIRDGVLLSVHYRQLCSGRCPRRADGNQIPSLIACP